MENWNKCSGKRHVRIILAILSPSLPPCYTSCITLLTSFIRFHLKKTFFKIFLFACFFSFGDDSKYWYCFFMCTCNLQFLHICWNWHTCNNNSEEKCFRKWAIDFGKLEELLTFSGAELLLDEIHVKSK